MKHAFLPRAAVAVLLAAGCTPATVNTVEVSRDGNYRTVDTDPVLSRVAEVTDVRKKREGELLRVQAEVFNRTSSEQFIQYRFVWLDADGGTVYTPLTNWTRQILQGGQKVSINGVAPEARVTDCRIEMQRTDAF